MWFLIDRELINFLGQYEHFILTSLKYTIIIARLYSHSHHYASINSKHRHPPRATPGVLHSTAAPGPGFILDDLPPGPGFCISIKLRLVQ